MSAAETTGAALQVSVREGVCTLTLNQPERRNALSNAVRDALIDALQRIAQDRDIGAVVLTGSGTAFCAGGDLKRDADAAPPTRAQRLASLAALHRLPALIAGLPQVTLAAVNGPAVGAGLALAAACDWRIAARTARFASQFLAVGLASDCGASWSLTRAVGPARARELLLLPEAIDAARAHEIGLVMRVVEPEQLASAAHALALRFARGPRLAQALMKKNLAAAPLMTLEAALELEREHQAEALLTWDHAEAVRAFAEKRAPEFQGR